MARAKKTPEDMPESVILAAPHGFIDEAGEHRFWQHNQIVTDADTIALLMSRRAPLQNIEYED